MTGSGREWGTGLGVADRIEPGDGEYPSLVRATAGLSGDGDERERAAHASKTVIRPLDARGADGTR